jgi:hypothetical protein
MTDRELANIISNNHSDKDYYKFQEWAQAQESHMVVRSELARVRALMERGRI